MKALLFLTPAFLLVGAAGTQFIEPESDGTPVQFFDNAAEASRAVISDEKRTSEAAAAYLRGLGYAGVEALQHEYSSEVSYRLGEGDTPGHSAEVSERILCAFDTVSGQHDGWASGLFWYQDPAAALADARRTGLPVLNLRLLGKLDDEFC